MILEDGLVRFLEMSIKEHRMCTVEGGFHRMLTDKETIHINNILNRYSYEVKCYRCETCEKRTGGESLYHIERVNLD